jgi:hypothetical protein
MQYAAAAEAHHCQHSTAEQQNTANTAAQPYKLGAPVAGAHW